MKKFVFILGIVLSCVLSSCGNNPIYKEVDGRKIEVMNSNGYIIRYIEFDGHEYVKYSRGNRGSICHSPKCHCLNEYKK